MDSHIIDKIVNRMKEINPAKVILFGSYALGEPHEDSDLDIIVVTNEDIMPNLTNMVAFHAQQAIERSLLIYDYVKKKLGGTT